MKTIIVSAACVFCISFSLNLKLDKLRNKELHSSSASSFFMQNSSFATSSLRSKGKKPETHIRSMSTEEYRDKVGDKPEEIRKYGEMVKKDNDNPALLKRKASTNVENEEMLLGDGEHKVLQGIEENNFLKNMNRGFDSFFHLDKDEDYFFKDNGNLFESPLKHGRYDKFLNERRNKVLDRVEKKI